MKSFYLVKKSRDGVSKLYRIKLFKSSFLFKVLETRERGWNELWTTIHSTVPKWLRHQHGALVLNGSNKDLRMICTIKTEWNTFKCALLIIFPFPFHSLNFYVYWLNFRPRTNYYNALAEAEIKLLYAFHPELVELLQWNSSIWIFDAFII